MLASFVSILSHPTYGNHLTLRKLKCALLPLQIHNSVAETGGRVGKQVHELVSEKGLFQDSDKLPLENSSMLPVSVETG
jgi:hypothetical protein